MQFSIFHSLAEQRITELINTLNYGRKKKEEYALLGVYPLGNELYLLSVYNEANGKYMFNMINELGEIPAGYPANFRIIQLISNDLPGDVIPEIVVRFRITEVNNFLIKDGYTTEQIEEFWNDCFRQAKKQGRKWKK